MVRVLGLLFTVWLDFHLLHYLDTWILYVWNEVIPTKGSKVMLERDIQGHKKIIIITSHIH